MAQKDPIFAAQVEKAAGKTALRLLKKDRGKRGGKFLGGRLDFRATFSDRFFQA